MKILLISHVPGQMCNCLTVFAHVLAAAIEFRVPVVNLIHERYLVSFNHSGFARVGSAFVWNVSKSSPFRSIYRRLLARHVAVCLRANYEQTLSAKHEVDLEQSCSNARRGMILTEVGYWEIRANRLLRKHQDKVRRYFRFNDEIESRANCRMAELRSRFDKLIGVHLRLGDYRSFQGGKYFVEPEAFRRHLEADRASLRREGLRAGYLLFSDEPTLLKNWTSAEVILSGENATGDLALMSRCDRLIGSSSSFSTWASFMGKVPLARVYPGEIELPPDRYRRYLPGGFSAATLEEAIF